MRCESNNESITNNVFFSKKKLTAAFDVWFHSLLRFDCRFQQLDRGPMFRVWIFIFVKKYIIIITLLRLVWQRYMQHVVLATIFKIYYFSVNKQLISSFTSRIRWMWLRSCAKKYYFENDSICSFVVSMYCNLPGAIMKYWASPMTIDGTRMPNNTTYWSA